MIIDFITFLLILTAFMFIITGLYLIFHEKLRELKKQKDKNINDL